jgi:hypothetical protein
MIAARQNPDLIRLDLVDDAVFVVDPLRPATGQLASTGPKKWHPSLTETDTEATGVSFLDFLANLLDFGFENQIIKTHCFVDLLSLSGRTGLWQHVLTNQHAGPKDHWDPGFPGRVRPLGLARHPKVRKGT